MSNPESERNAEIVRAAIEALVELLNPDHTRFMAKMLDRIKGNHVDTHDIEKKIERLKEVRSSIKSGKLKKNECFRLIDELKNTSPNKGEVLLANLVVLTEIMVMDASQNAWDEAMQQGRILLGHLRIIHDSSIDELRPYEEIIDFVKSQDFAFVYRTIGISFLNMGDYAGAEQSFLMGIHCNPDSADLYVRLSIAKSKGQKKDLEGAYKAAQKAIEMSGDQASSDCYAQMQYVCIFKLSSGEVLTPDQIKSILGEAKKCGHLGLKKEPSKLEILNNMGLVSEIEANYEEAMKWYAKASDIAPTHPLVIANLERVQRISTDRGK